jgi:rhodanese-related sulfurtransferase
MLYELLLLLLLPVLYLLLRGKRIPAAVAKAKLDAGGAVLVDVRESGEWRSGVAAHAARQLRREGFTVANLGGFANWAGRGLPVRLP